MEKETKMIFISNIIRIALNKTFQTNIEGIFPISSNEIEEKFNEIAKQVHFNFYQKDLKTLCKKVFEFGFMQSMLFESKQSENEIENSFRVIAEEMDLPHYIRMQTFFWFRNGIKKCEEIRPTFSLIYHINNDICKKLGTEQCKADTLPSQKELNEMFNSINANILEDIDIDNKIIENACAEISFQCGYLTAMNMKPYVLDDEFINILFQEVIGNVFGELNQSQEEILAYYLAFKEGIKTFHGYKALTGTRGSFF